MFKQLLFTATLLLSFNSFAGWKTFVKTDEFTDKKQVTLYSNINKGLALVTGICGTPRLSFNFNYESFKYTPKGITKTLVRIDKQAPKHYRTWSKSFGRAGVIADTKLVNKMKRGKQLVFRPETLNRKVYKLSLKDFSQAFSKAKGQCK